MTNLNGKIEVASNPGRWTSECLSFHESGQLQDLSFHKSGGLQDLSFHKSGWLQDLSFHKSGRLRVAENFGLTRLSESHVRVETLYEKCPLPNQSWVTTSWPPPLKAAAPRQRSHMGNLRLEIFWEAPKNFYNTCCSPSPRRWPQGEGEGGEVE